MLYHSFQHSIFRAIIVNYHSLSHASYYGSSQISGHSQKSPSAGALPPDHLASGG